MACLSLTPILPLSTKQANSSSLGPYCKSWQGQGLCATLPLLRGGIHGAAIRANNASPGATKRGVGVVRRLRWLGPGVRYRSRCTGCPSAVHSVVPSYTM